MANHLSKKLLLPELLDGILHELDMQDPQKMTAELALKKVRQSFRVPASWKSLLDSWQGTEESDWQTDNIGNIVYQIFCFMEKTTRYYGPVG